MVPGQRSFLGDRDQTGTAVAVGDGGTAFPVVLPDGSAVYIPNNRNGTVSVIDTGTDMVMATIRVSCGPQGLSRAAEWCIWK